MSDQTTAAPEAAEATTAAPAPVQESTSAAPKTGDVLDSTPADGASSAPAGDVLSGDDGPAQEGVPDEYTFEPPEGVTLEEASLDAYKAIAKDAALTQKQFEALAKFDIERSQAAEQQAVDEWNSRVEGWRQAARTDKEFGGQNYEANVSTALKAVEKFADTEFKALLKSPNADNPDGLAIGNHPAVLRFLHRIGKALGDPSLVQGDANTKATTDDAKLRRMYPSMYKDSA